MIRLLLTGLFGLSFLAGSVLCEESCTWLNSATAGGILGGGVETAITHPANNKNDETCKFTRRNGSISSTMHIEVITGNAPGNFERYLGQCGSQRTALRRIGNEAVACAGGGHDGNTSEQVIGRVRDRAFVVRISTSDKSTARSSLREGALSAASQVAGNLF